MVWAKNEQQWLFLLLVFGLSIRLYAALFFTSSTYPDVSVSAMMSQHIAEGRHFPLIYYNSEYVGTIEEYLGALFFFILPHSLFPSLLGFALVSFLALPFFYLWVRRMAGVKAALFGLALLSIGPPEFIYRHVFVGYPTVLMSGMAVSWLALRVVDGLQHGGRARRDAFLLGVFSGVGWWTNNLAVVYILPCAFLIVALVPWRRWAGILAYAVPGLLLGAAPWIIFALQQPEAVLFVTDVTAPRRLDIPGQSLHAVRLMLAFMDFAWTAEHPFRTLGFLVYLALIGLGLFAGASGSVRSNPQWRAWLIKAMPLTIVLTNIALCACSNRFAHVPATRYLLPVLPAWAAVAGAGAAWLAYRTARRWRVTGPVAIVLLLVVDFSRLPNHWDAAHQEKTRARRAHVEKLSAFAEDHEITAFFGDFFAQALSFESGERVRVTSYPGNFDRYRPFREAAILSSRIAVMQNHYGVGAFLATTGGRAQTTRMGGVPLHWDLRREPPRMAYLPVGLVESIEWEDGTPAGYLMDEDLDTPISLDRLPRGPWNRAERTVRVRLDAPQELTGLHAWGASGTWGPVLRISARDANGAVKVLHDDWLQGWFWSGPYPFLLGFMAFNEILFPPVHTDELWITLHIEDDEAASLISELHLLVADPAQERSLAEDAYAAEVMAIIEKNPPAMLYAPRWIAEQVRQRLPHIPNVVPSDYYEQYDGLDRYRTQPVVVMDRLPDALLVTPIIALERTQRLLEARGWVSEVGESVGPWTLIRVRRPLEGEVSARLYWTEQGVFLAETWFDKVPFPDDWIALLDKPIRFGRGISLESIWIQSDRVRPGEEVRMVYSWRCPPTLQPQQWAVFVHVRDAEGIRFQDDHVWLKNIAPSAIHEQPADWVFRTERVLTIPRDAEPGAHEIRFGLYDRISGKRLKPRGDIVERRRTVILRDGVTVE